MIDVTIRVEGMSCNGCVRNVTGVLKAQPGVLDAEVLLDDRAARVTYDPGVTSVDKLRQAVKDAGFGSPA